MELVTNFSNDILLLRNPNDRSAETTSEVQKKPLSLHKKTYK